MIDKRWFFVGVLVVGVFLAVVFLLPFFLNADAFRPAIEIELSNTLGRTATMGKLTFSLVQGSLVADDIVISDDPEFSDVPFLQAKKLDVAVEIFPLLMRRQVRITGLSIDSPSIQLIQHAGGRWNYSSLGSTPSQSAPSGQQASTADFRIGQFKIVNGNAMISSIPQAAKPFEYSGVNLTLKQFSFLKSFPFEVAANLPGGGSLSLTGEAGPITLKDTSQTPFRATLQLREFNPVSAGIIEPSKGISMNNDIDGEIKSDGDIVVSTGKIKASQLQLVPKGSPVQDPVDIDYSISHNLATHEGTVSDVTIHAGSAAAHVNGTFKPSPGAMILNLHLSSPGLPVDEIERLLPAVGIRLPSGSSLHGGTLTANLAITGPATAATMVGPVEIDNTKLEGFDLGSRIEGLKAPRTAGVATEIRVLKANVNSSPQETRLTNIYGEVPQVGTANGDGTVAQSGELAVRLTAKFNSSSALPNRSILLTISGTAASPSIQANIGATLR